MKQQDSSYCFRFLCHSARNSHTNAYIFQENNLKSLKFFSPKFSTICHLVVRTNNLHSSQSLCITTNTYTHSPVSLELNYTAMFLAYHNKQHQSPLMSYTVDRTFDWCYGTKNSLKWTRETVHIGILLFMGIAGQSWHGPKAIHAKYWLASNAGQAGDLEDEKVIF